MNYLKFEADELRETLSAEQPEPEKVARIEQFLEQALEIRERLINANLKLVISIGGKYLREDQRRSPHEFLDDSLSGGALGLVRAVDLFDIERGFAFSTYAMYAITNAFKQTRYAHRERLALSGHKVFCIDECDFPERSGDYSSPVVSAERSEFNQRLASLFNQHLDQIGNERCQRVIRGLYGLNGEAPKNKGEVAEELGISKDQVVQIENSTLKRLRTRLSRSGLSPD
jgi:RNA polymerase sigma factor (sigma-70 family)